MAGIDIPIPELSLVIHPPSIKDIAFMGEQKFFGAVQYLCVEKETLIQDERVLQSLTNFQVLLKVLEQAKNSKEKKGQLVTLLLLLFPDYQAVFMPKSLIFTKMGSDEEPIIVDDNNFYILQEAVRKVLCVSSVFQGKNIVYNPANSAAKRIADKIMRSRMKIAQQKAVQQESESVLTRYLSILVIGAGVRLEESLNFTLFQLFDLMERYTSYANWENDLRVRLAGGKPEKQVESWMRDLHSMG